MGGFFTWGRALQICEEDGCLELVGVGGGSEGISWGSVRALLDTTAEYGIEASCWPIFDGIELDIELPIGEAIERSHRLREAIRNVPDAVLQDGRWLRIVSGRLGEGFVFIIHAGSAVRLEDLEP